MTAALVDGYARSLNEEEPGDVGILQRSPPGPWKECALNALPPRLLARLALTPGCLVPTIAAEMATCPAMKALDPCLRGSVIPDLQNLVKMSASALVLATTPVPPIYTYMLVMMIMSFSLSLSLLTALSLSQWTSPGAWVLSSLTVGIIHVVLYTFYLAALELAEPFTGKLQVPLRMYEAALLHDVFCALQPITEADRVRSMTRGGSVVDGGGAPSAV
jgi:hypothetical protein